MSVAAIIAEYNPLHNGHLWHLQETRRLTGADQVIVIMSPQFTQRGEPAIADKWARASMALAAGADLVLELPVAFAVQHAQGFASGAISLLVATRTVDWLSFGSEWGRLEELSHLARFLRSEPAPFPTYLRRYLDRGHSFPHARASALEACHREQGLPGLEHLELLQLEDLVRNPNNILGLEYLQALARHQTSIRALAIPRREAGFHDPDLPAGRIASATSIRSRLVSAPGDVPTRVHPYLPPATIQLLQEEFSQGRGPFSWELFLPAVLARLRSASPSELRYCQGMDEGLENRLLEAARESRSVADLLQRVKTRRYTWTRLQRLLVHLLLGLSVRDRQLLLKPPQALYLRILACSRNGRGLLRHVKTNSSLPLVVRPARDLRSPRNRSRALRRMWELEGIATDLHALAHEPFPGPSGTDYTRHPVQGP